ncbi:MAG: MOSC N-terminal beta barrel domain-containing protein [Chroococcidiopsidaceae cyanobacterium CP_BM_ER_R8_30]|nr:MOSC N-terminal beta barrel domain-containing protein [Chroococcidiopsidaceae cyanobacterium CP_BM_ER_R8_30]
MISPYLAGISIYPIKSLDGIAVPHAKILASGALAQDREFALFDAQGRFVNGKRHAKVHLLRSSLDTESRILCLRIQGTDQVSWFHLDKERTALEAWLSDYFGFQIKFLHNSITGFPDDTNAPGPTVISTGTIEEVTSWFPRLSVDEMRSRLRTNLEIGGVPPFWEDRLFAQAGDYVQFQIGSVLFEGSNPCQRCVVPTRNSTTAETYPNFQKIFIANRQASLPSWVEASRFNHFYRLAINTCVPTSEVGKILHLGDLVKIIS